VIVGNDHLQRNRYGEELRVCPEMKMLFSKGLRVVAASATAREISVSAEQGDWRLTILETA